MTIKYKASVWHRWSALHTCRKWWNSCGMIVELERCVGINPMDLETNTRHVTWFLFVQDDSLWFKPKHVFALIHCSSQRARTPGFQTLHLVRCHEISAVLFFKNGAMPAKLLAPLCQQFPNTCCSCWIQNLVHKVLGAGIELRIKNCSSVPRIREISGSCGHALSPVT